MRYIKNIIKSRLSNRRIDKPRRIYLSFFLVILCSGIASATEPPGSPFGYTNGQFSVNESGGATYAIPIVVSPGTRGMQPELTLSYNSQSGNGLLGVGWSLNGLSVISRCPSTFAQDSLTDGVDFDANDQFCLDGERLMVVEGTHQGHLSQYRTEQNNFSKVQCLNNQPNGPQGFEVWTKSGLYMQYGISTDSRIEASGKADVLFWALNYVEDTKGNYMFFGYSENNTIGEYLPDEITYTGNSEAGVLASEYNSVKFEYETRTDRVDSYVGGSRVRLRKRLSKIKVYHESLLMREYRLSYATDTTGASFITSITELGSDESSLPATLFTWQRGDDGSYTKVDGLDTYVGGEKYAALFDISKVKMGDFNGDGKTDIYHVRGWNETLRDSIYLSQGDGTYTAIAGLNTPIGNTIAAANVDVSRIKLGDFNGDGLTDIYYVNGWGGSAIDSIYLSHGDGTYTVITGLNTWVGGNTTAAQFDISKIKFGDFNADGRTDIYLVFGWASTSLDQIYLSNGNGSYTLINGITTPIGNNFAVAQNDVDRIKFADFNGDGMTDIYYVNGSGGSAVDNVHLSHGNGTYTMINGVSTYIGASAAGAQLDIARIQFGDFNGDGKADEYSINGWGTAANDGIHISRGDGTYVYKQGPPTMITANTTIAQTDVARIHVLDFNGDGKSDILRINGWGDYAIDSLWLTQDKTGFTLVDGLNSWVNNEAITALSDISKIKFGDFNGDGKMDFYEVRGWGGYQLDEVHLNKSKALLLTQIDNGVGVDTEIQYKPITDSDVYTKGDSAVYPLMDYQGAVYVASWSKSANGNGGKNKTTYRYKNAELNLHGRGFRGFGETSITDEKTDIETIVFYERDFRCISSKVRRIEKRLEDGSLFNEKDNTIEIMDFGNGVYFSYEKQMVEKNYELNDSLITNVRQDIQYDSLGNITRIAIDHGDGHIDTTFNTYHNDKASWIIGRLTREEIKRQAPGQFVETRLREMEYDSTTGLLRKEIIEPNLDLLKIETEYERDVFGNVTVTKATGYNGTEFETRVDSAFYDSRGRFAVTAVNAVGHRESREYEPYFGNLSKLTGPNGLITTWEYDGFGRQTKETRPDLTTTTWAYKRIDSLTEPPLRSLYFVYAKNSGAAPSVIYYDSLDREVTRETIGYGGDTICIDTRYRANGLLKKVSDAYYKGESIYWTEYEYDAIGRQTKVTAPGDRITSVSYDGLTSVTTNPLDQELTRTVNALQRLVSSTDNLGHTVEFDYDSFGNLVETRDPGGNATQMAYDIRGNKVWMNDPNSNVATYKTNAFGELYEWEDSGPNSTKVCYDKLGRMTSRVVLYGVNGMEESAWEYDTQTNGIGKLGSAVDSGGYAETYTYDSKGRLDTTTYIDPDGVSYNIIRTYDSYSRPDTLKYPTGFSVWHVYNSHGYLAEVRNAATDSLYWRADTLSARGRLVHQTFGNGLTTRQYFDAETGRLERIRTDSIQNLFYEFNDIGNLTQRKDSLLSLTETFGYDGLNRLTSTAVAGGTSTAVTYDSLGNITYRSDVGCYRYAENSAGIHAVTSIRDSNNAIINAYTYDYNGNRISSSTSTLSWTNFNKISQATSSTTTVTFAYGPSRSRQLQTIVSGATLVSQRRYVGGLYERDSTQSGVTHYHYIRAGELTIAVYTDAGGGQTSTRYLHKDHLGSVQTISDEQGAAVETLSFDAWGARRDPTTWGPASGAVSSLFLRGFTGHEHLDVLGLINMNGRIYDPLIGRFLSPDPFVQFPEMSQSLNRYSYVLNNPLSLTDPSGFNVLDDIVDFVEKHINSVVEFVKQYAPVIAAVGVGILTGYGFGLLAGPLGIGGAVGKAVLSGAGFGFGTAFSGTLLAGGSIQDALRAGLIAGAVGAYTGGIAQVYGQGIGSVMSGGLRGFIESRDLDGMLKGFATGLIPVDLLTGSLYAGSHIGNFVINRVRDGLTGYILGGELGARRQVFGGLATDVTGHVAGLIYSGGELPELYKGVYFYETSKIRPHHAFTLGNVVTGAPGLVDGNVAGLSKSSDSEWLRLHERGHFLEQASRLGPTYIPLQAVSFSLGNATTILGIPGKTNHFFFLEQHLFHSNPMKESPILK